MSIVLVGSTSGSITLQEPAVAGSTTINLPATSGTALVAPTALTVPNTTGTVMVSGNMPAFAASRTGVPQSISSATWTKVTFNNEEFDTNNNFASSTFTPTVAGYYLISGCITLQASANTISSALVGIYKNATQFRIARPNLSSSNFSSCAPTVTALVYMNGSTDYIELYGYINGTSPEFDYGSTYTYIQGVLVRAA